MFALRGKPFEGGFMTSLYQSISVAVCVLAAPWRWRRSCGPISYAVRDVSFSFPGIERRKDTIGMIQAETLNPLWSGQCWR